MSVRAAPLAGSTPPGTGVARRPCAGGEVRIAMSPGMAFDTGVHETTRLMKEALLDVGTRWGIPVRTAAVDLVAPGISTGAIIGLVGDLMRVSMPGRSAAGGRV